MGTSLTSVVCRVLESIIRDYVLDHLNKNKFIRKIASLAQLSQHGFSRGQSCPTNLLTFFDLITHEVDKKHEIDVIYQGL